MEAWVNLQPHAPLTLYNHRYIISSGQQFLKGVIRLKLDNAGKLTRRDFLKGAGTALVVGLGVGVGAYRLVTPGFPKEVKDLVFVFNTGDKTVSIIDAAKDEVVKTAFVDTTASWPSNQWISKGDYLWLNTAKGVQAFKVSELKPIKTIQTGSNANWQEVTPDGKFLIVSARESDRQYKIVADPESPDFLSIVARLDTYKGAGPCDITVGHHGRFGFIPDLYGSTFAVMDIERFERLVFPTEPVVAAAEEVKPFMATVSPDGKYVFVETFEGGTGTEMIWDVSAPKDPVEVRRLTQKEGLGINPWSDEFTPDGRYNFIINRGSGDITVVDLDDLEIVNTIPIASDGKPPTGDFSPAGDKFYVSLPPKDRVAVVDVEKQKVIKTIEVGPGPAGVVGVRAPVPAVERALPSSVSKAGGPAFEFCDPNTILYNA